MSNDQFWWPDNEGWPSNAPPAYTPRSATPDPMPAQYLFKLHQIEHRQLAANLDELKGRVASVESTLARGVLALVANLAAVLATLVTGYLGM